MEVPFWVILMVISVGLVVSSLVVALTVISRRSRGTSGIPVTQEEARDRVLIVLSKLGVKIPDNPNLFIPSSTPTPASSGMATSMLIVLLFLLGDGAGAYFTWRADLHAHQLLTSEGQVVRAKITDRYIVENDESSDDYYIVYGFRARGKDGAQAVFSTKADVGSDLYDTFEVGGTVEVIYAPSDPAISRLKSKFNPNFPHLSVGTIITSVFASLGLLALLIVYGGYRNAARLDSDGATTYAKITDLNSSTDSEGSTSYNVIFEMDNGRKMRNSIAKKRYQVLSVGNSLRVRYLVEKPEIYRVEWDG